jgi:uncharacterized membrane protein
MRRLKLLSAVAAYCAVAILISRSGAQPWLRSVAVLPLTLVLPGWLCLRVVAPRRAFPRLESSVYAVSMSISICALGGVAIQLVFGLDDWVWFIFLAGMAIALAALATLLGRSDMAIPKLSRTPSGFSFGTALAVVLAVAISAGSIVLASSGAATQRGRAHFAELWILPGKAAGQPVAEVGVGNREGARRDFEIRVARPGRPVLDESVNLENGATWSRRLRLGSEAEPVRALLLSNGTVLRSVWLRREAAG